MVFNVVKDASKQGIIVEGTVLYYAHCVYIKAVRMGLIPTLHRTYVDAHYDYYYTVQYAEACHRVVRMYKAKLVCAGIWRGVLV